MATKADKLKAQLKLVEAEDKFVAKKEAGKLTVKDRHDLRAVRQEYREKWRGPPKDGGAAPATTGSATEVN